MTYQFENNAENQQITLDFSDLTGTIPHDSRRSSNHTDNTDQTYEVFKTSEVFNIINAQFFASTLSSLSRAPALSVVEGESKEGGLRRRMRFV